MGRRPKKAMMTQKEILEKEHWERYWSLWVNIIHTLKGFSQCVEIVRYIKDLDHKAGIVDSW